MTNLLATSLKDFSSDAWWAAANALVDGDASVSSSTVVAAVRAHTREGDLRRAAASYGGDPSDDNMNRGAELLAEKILKALEKQGIIVRNDNDVSFAPEYLAVHSLDGGGVRLAYNADGIWTTYDALPIKDRAVREAEDSERKNDLVRVQSAGRMVRNGLRKVSVPPKGEDAKALFASLKRLGYLDVFPISVDPVTGDVIDGRHRLTYSALARKELEAELVDVENEVDRAFIEARIASLDRDRILTAAVEVTGDAQQVRAARASDVKVKWDGRIVHPKFAKELAADGASVAEIAKVLERSERSLRRWTASERVDVTEVQHAEAKRLSDLGWSSRKIGKHLGKDKKTITSWVGNFGQPHGYGRNSPPPEKPARRGPKDPERAERIQRESWINMKPQATIAQELGVDAKMVSNYAGKKATPLTDELAKAKLNKWPEESEPIADRPKVKTAEPEHVHTWVCSCGATRNDS